MQAPLSSTASGQHLRTGPSSGPLSSSPLLGRPAAFEPRGLWEKTRSRLRAGSTATCSPVADGPGLAHDAGNLLGALRLYCGLLARPGVLRDEHRHYAEELQLLSQRSGALIDRLLHPAVMRRPANGSEGPIGEQVVVPQVIEQCRGLLNAITRRAVEVVYGAEAAAPVPVPRETMERILVNLTKNAAEASSGGGAITLRVSRVQEAAFDRRPGTRVSSSSHSRIVLSVEDHGLGMSMAAVKVLLGGDQSFAETPSLAGAESHGLGLRIVRELVQQSGGELRLNTRSGCGTAIEIAWAVVEPVPAPEAKSHTSEHLGRPASYQAGTATMYATSGTEGGASC